MRENLRTSIAVFLTAFVAGGCATAVHQLPGGPHERVVFPAQVESTAGEKVVTVAARLIGTPYRYGGESPRKGFDCSGLVFYSFEQTGLKVPRTWEYTAGAEREVVQGIALGADFVYRRFDNPFEEIETNDLVRDVYLGRQ